MRGTLTFRLLALTCALACALGLNACGGGGGSTAGSAGGHSASQVALGLSSAGDQQQLSVTLSATDAAGLYQLACRVAYDPRALRFSSATRGTLVDSRAVFFAGAKGEGYVPLAFTYHRRDLNSGTGALAGVIGHTGDGARATGASGSIAVLRFDVLDPAADPQVRLVSEPKYLVARDSAKHALQVHLSGAAQ